VSDARCCLTMSANDWCGAGATYPNANCAPRRAMRPHHRVRTRRAHHALSGHREQPDGPPAFAAVGGAGLASFLNAVRRMAIAVEPCRLWGPRLQWVEANLPSCRRDIRRILVCLDHSSFSDVGLKQAICLAKIFNSAITLLHVLPNAQTTGMPTTDALGQQIDRLAATAYLERLETETTEASGLQVDSRLERGNPAQCIPSVAHELGADLIVLGSHGESELTAWNLGSTTQHVLAVARKSVLVARSMAHSQGEASKRILVPLDGSPRAENVLLNAARIARVWGAELLLAHVVAEPSSNAMLRAGQDLDLARRLATHLESSARRYLENLRNQLGGEGLPVRAIVLRCAEERQALLDVARNEAVTLVVVSAYGNTCNHAQSFGSTTGHLLAYSPVPLLVLQDLPEVRTETAIAVQAHIAFG
jgi:nucleotide-binding universal stress UspA family protein